MTSIPAAEIDPQVLQHPYGWPEGHDEISVYRGPLVLGYQDGTTEQVHGDLALQWSPRPRAVWRSAPGQPDDEAFLVRLLSGEPDPGRISVPPGALPAAGPLDAWGVPEGQEPGGYVPGGPVVVGDGAPVDRLDFFLVNGPQAHDLGGLAHAEGAGWYRGRLRVTGGGWNVVVDQPAGATERLRELARAGGHRPTHVVRLTRSDGGAFDPQEGLEAAQGVAGAYGFAACRRAAVAVPVGSSGGTPCWTWLAAPSADPWSGGFTWLDPAYGGEQIASVLPAWLDQWADPGQRLVLRLALGYHVTASRSNGIESSIAAAISGLVLLSEARYVGGNRMTDSQWEGLNTPGQIRALLDEYRLDRTANPAYAELAAVAAAARAAHVAKRTAEQAAKGKTYNPPTDPPDDLDGVLALRNLVAHPTALSRGQIPPQAWVQAWMTVAEWFDLALLARLGHEGRYFPRRQENRWHGASVTVPFAGHSGVLGI